MNSLPHPETIRKWYQNVNGLPGISKEAINTLKLKIDKASSEGKVCYGYMDLGTGIINDSLPVAQYALVFLVTCINSHYKIPIAYYLIHSLSGKERANLLTQCLLILHEANVHIVSVTVDGATSNISMLNKMGANLSMKDVNQLVPYFIHPKSKKKIYVLLDACHMLKLIRGAFDNKYILWDKDGQIICWKYVKLLVDLQEKEELHAGTKIRRRHLNWRKEKMKVILAAQVCSTSVANALLFCEQDLKLPDFVGCKPTARFCLEINNIFDLLNFNKNQSARCITAENYNEICEQVNNHCNYLQGLKDAEGPILKSNLKVGFFGLFLCLQSVLGLSKILLSDDNFQYLLTYKLSQDHLETFFSAVRSRGGFNNNPNAKQFMSAYKRLLVHAEVDISKSANNIVLDETVVLNVSSAILVPHKDINNVMQDDTDEHDIYSIDKSDHDYSLYHNEWLHSDYVQDVVTYIAGFIARSVTKIIKCEICASYLIQDKVLSHLQKRKCRGGLISASENLVQTCLIAEKVFRIHNNVLTTKNIMSKLVLETIATIPSDVFKNETHLYDQSPMADHRKQLLEIILTKYFNLRLHHKSASKKDTIVRIRSMYTKLILFKNQ
ncbi:THAP domain-containing protein 9 [Trachymyrmex cornetzi]|uniref:THAP domain-containing protein 9 n=1 Tax=Trachymyrmex cornetzi TaxID=471704 RepID=A0A151J1E1_9HYME|nr:THAP domain-containing protein 9 [Trachymyrmex cornetzi]